MELEDYELYIHMQEDDEFKEIVVDLLEIINDFYGDEVYNKYKRLLNVLNDLDVTNYSDATKNEINIIKQGLDEYEQRCADFRLHKSIFEEAGLLK